MDYQKNGKIFIKNKILNKKTQDKNIEKDKKYKEDLLNKYNKRKEKIHSEIFKLINNNMENIEKKTNINNTEGTININSSRNLETPNLQNYSGERISIATYSNFNDKDNISNIRNNDIFKNNEENKKIRDMKILNDNINLNILRIDSNINNNIVAETITENETLINNSNYSINNETLDKNDSKEEKENISSEGKNENKIRNIFVLENIRTSPYKHNRSLNEKSKRKIYFKEKKRSLSPSYSLFDSTSTSNTYEKKKSTFKFHQIIDDIYNSNYLKYNKTELINFFSEINLPTMYAHKFIENGFDDLNIILSLTKTSIAITNKNLKDIGIFNAGHRAKILIHLEERAEIFPFYLEKDIIYNNKSCINYLNNDSLFAFLNKIRCQKYVNNFRRNGYYNSELLFSQMFTREHLTREILVEDLSIDNEVCINKIIQNLYIESKNYLKHLKKNNHGKKILLDDKMYHNSCETCLIF